MKHGLTVGLRYEHSYTVPKSKIVSALYPEAEAFTTMPPVFATGFMVGFLEWACMLALEPYLEYPTEQTVGTYVAISHLAPTPVGLTVVAHVELIAISERQFRFSVQARDNIDLIADGYHERHLINTERFNARVLAKQNLYHKNS